MSKKILWNDFTLPPINLWVMPTMGEHRMNNLEQNRKIENLWLESGKKLFLETYWKDLGVWMSATGYGLDDMNAKFRFRQTADYSKYNDKTRELWEKHGCPPLQYFDQLNCEIQVTSYPGWSTSVLYRIDPNVILTDRGWKYKSESINNATPEEWDKMNQDRIDKELETNGFAMLTEEKQNPLDTQVGGDHYKEMNIQPWEVMRANNTVEEYTAYHINTVLGYLMRHKSKGGLQDIKKSRHHLDELISYLEDGYV